MGYTHYFRYETLDSTKFQEALQDCEKIIKAKKDILAGWNGTGKPECSERIAFNGKNKNDESHESFIVEKDGNGFNFCKTARKQYDIVVVACLAVLSEKFKKAFKVSSDGTREEWKDGVNLAREVLGRKVPNPIVDED